MFNVLLFRMNTNIRKILYLSKQLFDYHDKKLVSIGKMLHLLVSFISFYNAIKDSFKKEIDELTEYVYAYIHADPIVVLTVNKGN